MLSEILLYSVRNYLIFWNLILSGTCLLSLYRVHFQSVRVHIPFSVVLRKIYIITECDVCSKFSYMSLIILRQTHFVNDN